MTDASPLSSLLIIGGTKAGKTHYGGQLLRRLETKKYHCALLALRAIAHHSRKCWTD